jgi:transcription initiation factor TFIID TATA-box-binding protein
MTDPSSSLHSLSPGNTIDNICGKFKMNTSLDLHYLASKIWNSAYNPRRLPALIIRKSKPRGTVLVYGSGSAMVIGAESM